MANEVTTTETQQNGMMAIIAAAASDQTVDVAKMMALLDMQERIMAKQAEIDFSAAMGRLSGKLASVKIGRTRSVSYKEKEAFKFASYEDIDVAIRPLLSEEGFSLSFTSEPRAGDGGGAVIVGTLSHKGGHSRSASLPLPLDTSGGKNNIQGMGSTISYGKRYTLGMLLNIVTCEDDDGAGGDDYVSNDQAVEIDLLITATKSDKARFLKVVDAEEVQKIKVKNYDKAIKLLNEKKSQQVKK